MAKSNKALRGMWGANRGPKLNDKQRKAREERRALKLKDYDQGSISEAYRAAAREKRHESIAFLKDILANRNPQGQQKAETPTNGIAHEEFLNEYV